MRSTQGLQFNQIQCGKVTGAASPSSGLTLICFIRRWRSF